MPGVVSTEESHTCWWGEIPIPFNITEVFCADYDMRIQKKKKTQILCFSQTQNPELILSIKSCELSKHSGTALAFIS